MACTSTRGMISFETRSLPLFLRGFAVEQQLGRRMCALPTLAWKRWQIPSRPGSTSPDCPAPRRHSGCCVVTIPGDLPSFKARGATGRTSETTTALTPFRLRAADLVEKWPERLRETAQNCVRSWFPVRPPPEFATYAIHDSSAWGCDTERSQNAATKRSTPHRHGATSR